MAGNSVNPRHFILTGAPGVGKTTLVKSIQQELCKKGIECKGFLTEEVRSGGRRIGFDVITTSGQRGQLARVSEDQASFQGAKQRDYRVGQYSVNLLSFEQTALPTLLQNVNVSNMDSTRQVFVIDEVGKMEMFSQSFKQTVEKLMFSQGNTVVATIPIPKGKPIPLVEKIRNSPSSKVFEVTRQNRDNLLEEILPDLMSQIISV